jgi:hypothetical protein
MKEGLGCSWLTDWAGSERETRPQPARHNATLIDGASRAGWREMSRRGEREENALCWCVSVGGSSAHSLADQLNPYSILLSHFDAACAWRRVHLRACGDAIHECIPSHDPRSESEKFKMGPPYSRVDKREAGEIYLDRGRTDQSDGNSFADGSTI